MNNNKLSKRETLILKDGDIISAEYLKFFSNFDIRTRRVEDKVNFHVDFVGFIIEPNIEIVVFPKNFNDPTIEDVSLLFDILINSKKNDRELNLYDSDNVKTNFPFKSFYYIYNYFLKFGLYKDETIILKDGYYGNVSWKDSIKKERMIFTEKGIIISPFSIKRKKHESNLITQTMTFAINYTAEFFSSFIDIGKINNVNYDRNLLNNIDSLIISLQREKELIFKDVNKNLINNLISFLNGINRGGIYSFKNYNFNLLWQNMVHVYLSKKFIGVTNGEYLFSEEIIDSNDFIKEKKFIVSSTARHNIIFVDHYLLKNNNQYIFDSKYYIKISELEYKQLVYGILLNGLLHKEDSSVINETYNCLILPGNSPSNKHFVLTDKFDLIDTVPDIDIIYLDMKMIMEFFLTYQ